MTTKKIAKKTKPKLSPLAKRLVARNRGDKSFVSLADDVAALVAKHTAKKSAAKKASKPAKKTAKGKK